MVNPRNLFDVMRYLADREGETTSTTSDLLANGHHRLFDNIQDRGQEVRVNFERDTAGRDAERPLRGEPAPSGSRDLNRVLPPGTGGRQGQIPI